jgi:anti-sigma-K factor RskA
VSSYDESSPSPRYHAEWSRKHADEATRLADRAVFWSRVSLVCASVAVLANVANLLFFS